MSQMPFVDGSRINMQGWSFGGYMTSLCMTKGAEVFHAGIAVAPVTNWKYYDSIYTERFLRTPQENKSGYEDNSPVNYAKMLNGPFLLVHGSADDNVHYQNAEMLVNELIKYNKNGVSRATPKEYWKNAGILFVSKVIYLFYMFFHFCLALLNKYLISRKGANNSISLL
jgi:dipeptidyl-peptidase-4